MFAVNPAPASPLNTFVLEAFMQRGARAVRAKMKSDFRSI